MPKGRIGRRRQIIDEQEGICRGVRPLLAGYFRFTGVGTGLAQSLVSEGATPFTVFFAVVWIVKTSHLTADATHRPIKG